MSEDQTEQSWEVGQSVIHFSPYGSYGRNDHGVTVHPIESVAPKSFVVNGTRYFKDKLKSRTKGGFHHTTWLVCAMDDERAPYLLAERSARRQRNKVAAVQKLWDREGGIEHAADLQVELNEWVKAEQERQAAWEALRLIRPTGNMLD